MARQHYENPVDCNNTMYVGTDAPESVYVWIGDDQGLSYYMTPSQAVALIKQLEEWLEENKGSHQRNLVPSLVG